MAADGSRWRWKYRLRKTIVLLILLIPLWSFLVWYFQPDRVLRVMLLDKTAQDFRQIEHRAFTWVLNHHHYVKPDGTDYSQRIDYLGYFPEPDNLLRTNDLRGADQKKIDSIANGVDVGYFIDTYGSYYEDWSDRVRDIPEKGKIYGGLESEDVSLLSGLIEKNKLVIAEFSIFGSPTPKVIRERAEALLGVRFTGWVGRYFTELDTSLNQDIPKWIPDLFHQRYDSAYAFKGPGIGFFHEDGRLLILPESEMVHPLPIVETEEHLADALGVDEFIRYPFWFEICEPDTGSRTVSQYRIYAGSQASAKMRALGIPQSFPAVLSTPDWRTIYLAGDFTDNPVGMFTRYFAGVENLHALWYDNRNPEDRRKFFWDYYRPFMEGVLERYTDEVFHQKPNPVSLPARTFYTTMERMLINRSTPPVPWAELPDPMMEMKPVIDSTDTSFTRLIYPDPTHLVVLGSFGRRSDADRFRLKYGILPAAKRFNPSNGMYDLAIPCYSDSTAYLYFDAVRERYPQARIKN